MEGGQHASWIPHHQRTKEQHELISWMDKRYSKVCGIYACGMSICECCVITINHNQSYHMCIGVLCMLSLYLLVMYTRVGAYDHAYTRTECSSRYYCW
jgi:hypothetical protein